jgi:FKBP-type peptidyl-prolyl cis-trans isomerase SlyD
MWLSIPKTDTVTPRKSLSKNCREQFKDIPGLTVGQRIRATNKENNEVEMLSVVEIRDDTVLVDFNHPLAGQVLNFQIVIVDVREPTEKEREQGFASTTKPLL